MKKNWHVLDMEDLLSNLATTAKGLEQKEARQRLESHGRNSLVSGGSESLWVLFFRQINNPIGWLLIAAGMVAIGIGKHSDAIVVFGAVIINGVIGFVQEYRAGKAISSLSAMVPENTMVLRDGQATSIAVEELVPGDVVLMQSGDKVPADLRLFLTKNLLIDESVLTGESLPVAKNTSASEQTAALGDRLGMAYSGTLVVQGTCSGVVVATGQDTELGHINMLLNQTVSIETPLMHQLNKVSLRITIAVVFVVALLVSFGIWVKNAPVGEALLVAVSLAAAAIPEGLPAVVTIAMAIGVRRMASRHAVIRHLPAVETLGSTSVICSDKTGTLTRNEMTVQVAWSAGREYRFSGIGYAPYGEVEHDGLRIMDLPEELAVLVKTAALCNDAMVYPEDGGWNIAGDPTEAAMVVAGIKAGLDVSGLRLENERLDVLPFESETKFMMTLNKYKGSNSLLLKGAPESILKFCRLSREEAAKVEDVMSVYAAQGMRVIAFANKPAVTENLIDDQMLMNRFQFVGLMGMIDPPRSEAMDAIVICHKAGITVKMITGDHPITAEAIGRQLGLLGHGQKAMQGFELDGLSDQQIREAVNSTNVFARVAPEHKIRLVEALQSQGHVVAMTGDGVNDAPALKKADIGVAMGITGTAVSREAAKMILVDDNFATIAASVEEGRRVYDNLVKSLAFVLPTNLGLACTLSFAMFFFPTIRVEGVNELLMAMSPTQTLWVNLVASVTLSVPLAFEALEPDAMKRPPRRHNESIFSSFIVIRLFVVALIMSGCACGMFLFEYYSIAGHGVITAELHSFAIREAQTMCVTTIVFTQIFYLFNCRSLKDSVLKQGFFSNPTVFVGIGMLLLLHLLFVYVQPFQTFFGTAPLDLRSWCYSILAGAIVLPLISIEKNLWKLFKSNRFVDKA